MEFPEQVSIIQWKYFSRFVLPWQYFITLNILLVLLKLYSSFSSLNHEHGTKNTELSQIRVLNLFASYEGLQNGCFLKSA
jgi:hypothetical protein